MKLDWIICLFLDGRSHGRRGRSHPAALTAGSCLGRFRSRLTYALRSCVADWSRISAAPVHPLALFCIFGVCCLFLGRGRRDPIQIYENILKIKNDYFRNLVYGNLRKIKFQINYFCSVKFSKIKMFGTLRVVGEQLQVAWWSNRMDGLEDQHRKWTSHLFNYFDEIIVTSMKKRNINEFACCKNYLPKIVSVLIS